MDIQTTTQSPKSKVKLSVIIAFFLVILAFCYWLLKPSLPTVKASDLRSEIVRQGTLDIKVPVFGEYASRYERLISATDAGQVSEIFLRAGADVTAQQVIAKLTNPDLEQQHFAAQSQLSQMQSEFASFQLQKQNEQLNFQAQLADIESDIQAATLDVEVNQRLALQGIAAKIELERAQLRLAQLQKRLEFANYRFSKQQEMHKLELAQQEMRLQQQQKQVELIASKVANLTIKAGIEGTLQSLTIELGQTVVQGQAIAKVGSKTQLMARLSVPQRLAQRIKIGANVAFKHGAYTFSGDVVQLGSVIENGFVAAEVHFSEPPPTQLRPAQPANALLHLEQLDNALFVTQHPGMAPLATVPLYKKVPDEARLEAASVRFGELSEQFLVIEDGAKAGDVLVINDLSQWHNFTQLALDKDTL
jgi:HlyD family secretion protein